ncbi:MAG: glycoside hydrolase family 16 protein [Sporichthyaceae bacterium]
MKSRIVGCATAVALAVGGSLSLGAGPGANAQILSSAAATVDSTASAYSLVWRDEFNGSSLSKKWSVLPTGPFAGRTCALASKKVSTVKNGFALISVIEDTSRPATAQCPHHYLNAQIGTHESKSFLYGKFSARLKTQKAIGMHSAFWSLPGGEVPPGVSPNDLPGSQGVEIDVTEYFGDTFGTRKGSLYSYIYWPRKRADGTVEQVKTGGRQSKAPAILNNKLPSDGFHVYTVEWTPTQYIFSIDGQETSRVRVGVSKRPQYLLLSMLTSDYEVPDINRSKLPATMKVDWVRVYQKR